MIKLEVADLEFADDKVGDSDPLEESYCQYVFSGQIPESVDDSHVVPIFKALRTTDAMEIRACMGVPIRLSDGSVFGTFCCYSRRPRMAVNHSVHMVYQPIVGLYSLPDLNLSDRRLCIGRPLLLGDCAV